MKDKEASKCLSLLTKKFGMYFRFSYHAEVMWPVGQVPKVNSPCSKYGSWCVRVMDDRDCEHADDMVPSDNECPGNMYSSWYCTDAESSYGCGFHVKARDGECIAKLVSLLSGRCFSSRSKSVSVPCFSSYEELRLKLEFL